MALAAHLAARQQEKDVAPEEYARLLQAVFPTEAHDFFRLIGEVVESVTARRTTESFAEALGLGGGVSGYMYHTVPVVQRVLITWRESRPPTPPSPPWPP